MTDIVERLRYLHAEIEQLCNKIERLREALEKIKFRNWPGTTNHELAKEALSQNEGE